MRRLSLTLAAALVLAVPGACAQHGGQQAAPAPAATTAVRSEHVRALTERYVAEGRVPGIVVAYGVGDLPPTVVANGRIAFDEGAAKADGDSLWRVYSMTKPITGIAAMMLVEQGKLELDQPISDLIPAFKDMKVLVDPAKGLESRPAARPITVRHLLTHTAGLGYVLPGATGPLIDAYNRLGINPAQINALLEPQMRAARPTSLEEFANRVASVPLLTDPGTRWSYSIGLDVLGRVIEVASGMPFDKFVETRIFAPLKMKSSYWTVPADRVGDFAANYMTPRLVADAAATSVYLQPPSFPYGGAGLVMSARDYDRFLRMLLNEGTLDGVRVLKPETVRLAMSDLLPQGVDRATLAGMTRDSGVPMGFGAGGSVYLADRPGGPGKGTFGWGGAAGTIGWVDPANRVRATAMINLFADTELKRAASQAVYADLRP